MEVLLPIIAAAVSLVVGAALGYQRKGVDIAARLADADEQRRRLLRDAESQAENLKKQAELDAREISLRESEKMELEVKQSRGELQEWERRVRGREEALDKREDSLEKRLEALSRRDEEFDRRERLVLERETGLQAREASVATREQAVEQRLSEVAELSADDARRRLLEQVEADHKLEIARRIKQVDDEGREVVDRRARRILAMAIQRLAGEYVTEKTVSVVSLPNEEMKGRIIGREGRNIRAIEAATGVDLIIDDTPEAVVISCFNPFRREVARLALERLIADGRIHPSRIEDVVREVEEELERTVREAGEQATFDLGLADMHGDLLRVVGQLRYRTSYGQNQYKHALEVGHLAGLMASELGLDPKIAKRAGLLHDIGKVLDESAEGSHAVTGAEFAKRCGEAPRVVNAIASHHEEVAMESIYAILVQAADAMSGARPGARREILESYIKRLEDLERIALSFTGVERAFAIQAGREIRIVAINHEVSDSESVLLARNVARKIESELTYPGQIKVTVIRETRAVDLAR